MEAETRMTFYELITIASCLFSVANLIWIEYQLENPEVRAHPAARELEMKRKLSKFGASLSFVLIAVPAFGRDAFGTWMFIGLVAGAAGDVALLGRTARAFMIGLGAFLIGHIAYVIGIAQVVPPTRWVGEAGVGAILPIVVAAIAIKRLWPRLGAFKIPVLVYVLAIVAMVVGAFAARGQLGHGTMLAIGATLFFASDLAVARDRFLMRDFSNKLYGLPAYYVGQLLIAWAIR
jgi:uncharacterized membrane protein YhhN